MASDALNLPDRINSQSSTNIYSIASTAVCARMKGYGDLLENLSSRTSFVKRSKLIPDHTDKVSPATLFVSLQIFQIATTFANSLRGTKTISSWQRSRNDRWLVVTSESACARIVGYGDLLENLSSRTSFVKRSKLIPNHTDKVSTAHFSSVCRYFRLQSVRDPKPD